jgi:hypothetical protein
VNERVDGKSVDYGDNSGSCKVHLVRDKVSRNSGEKESAPN